jgi:CDP-diacylglycerol--glycerol-3-phosphate 3-phosphatidyltransferase
MSTTSASLALPFAVMGLSALISYQRAKAESLGLNAKGGLMERAERIVLLCIGLFLQPWIDNALVWVMWLMLVLITITAVQRFVKVWKQAAVAPITQARIDLRRARRASRRDKRRTRVPLRTRVPRRRD